MDRQCKDSLRLGFTYGKITALVSEIGSGRLQVNRDRIVNCRPDVVSGQVGSKLVTAVDLNDERMVRDEFVRLFARQEDVGLIEELSIQCDVLAASLDDRAETSKAIAQNRGLERIHTGYSSKPRDRIAIGETMISQQPHRLT